MADAQVFDMPVKLGLDLATVIRAGFADTEWKLVDDVVNEVYRVGLGMPLMDLRRTRVASSIAVY